MNTQTVSTHNETSRTEAAPLSRRAACGYALSLAVSLVVGVSGVGGRDERYQNSENGCDNENGNGSKSRSSEELWKTDGEDVLF